MILRIFTPTLSSLQINFPNQSQLFLVLYNKNLISSNNKNIAANEILIFKECKLVLENDDSVTLSFMETKMTFERDLFSDVLKKIFDFDNEILKLFFQNCDTNIKISYFSILWSSNQINTNYFCKSQSFLIFYPFETTEKIDKNGVYEIPLIGIISNNLNDNYWFSQISEFLLFKYLIDITSDQFYINYYGTILKYKKYYENGKVK